MDNNNKEYILGNNYKTEVKYTECTLINKWINPWYMLPQGISKITNFLVMYEVLGFVFCFVFFLMGMCMHAWISQHFTKYYNKGQNTKNKWENEATIVSQSQSI